MIDTINSLLPKKDIERFKEYCARSEYDLSECDANPTHDFELILNGDEEDEEEMYDSDNVPADLFEETERERKVREGYLAREMWKGYKEWLGRRPQELERFEQFMVRNFSLLSCSFDAVPITNHIVTSYTTLIKVLKRRVRKSTPTRWRRTICVAWSRQ